MGFARKRTLSVTADGSANYTQPCSVRRGGMATVTGSFVGTVTLQRRGADNNWDDYSPAGTAVTFTGPDSYALPTLAGQAEWRLNVKSGAYTSGTINLMVEGW